MNRTALALGAAAGAAAIALRARQRRAQQLERLAAVAFEALLNAIDANDPQTGAHVRRVAAYALVLARAADLDEHRQHSIERVALFHDIGKIHAALFDIVHEGESGLSESDRALVATHTLWSAEVLEPLSSFYPDLCAGVLSHHERWDGRGYPRGLRGEEIPLSARIVSIVDAFDAMTHRRRYRSGRSLPDAATAIEAGRGTQFDPDLTDLFLSPPVAAEVRAATRAHYSPRSLPSDRRQSTGECAVPDVSFRWRRRSSLRSAPQAEGAISLASLDRRTSGPRARKEPPAW